MFYYKRDFIQFLKLTPFSKILKSNFSVCVFSLLKILPTHAAAAAFSPAAAAADKC